MAAQDWGLAICARLSRLMKGTVWAESELGKGSTFHFSVRLGLADSPPKPVEKRIVQGNRVLVVDDNATNRLILDEMLRNWGIDVTSVESVDDALAALQTARETDKPYQLVLSDVHMPERDGFDLAQQMHDDGSMAEAVVMMLTSGDRSGDIAKCRDLGVAAYLRKPVKQSELFDVLVKALAVDGMDESEPSGLSDQKTDVTLPPLRVLLAEDSVVNQKLALALLNKWGLTVSVAQNGAEALELVTTQNFDLVLMDVQMPEMDGLEATRQIRDHETRAGGHLPIIAMTAHAMTGDREECLAAGMDSYVSKPVRSWQLKQEIAGFFPEGTVTVSAGSPPESSVTDDSAKSALGTYAVDWPKPLKVVQGDRDLLREVAAAFLEESRMVMRELKKAAESGDAKTFQRSAQPIKASFRTFGVESAHDLAFDLECAGKEDRIGSVTSQIPELESAVAMVSEQLKHFVDTREIPS